MSIKKLYTKQIFLSTFNVIYEISVQDFHENRLIQAIIWYKYERTKKKIGKYTMLVKTSITTPLIDQFVLRTLKYKTIKAINAIKQSKQ